MAEGTISGHNEVPEGVWEGKVGVKVDAHGGDGGVGEDGNLEGEALGRGCNRVRFTTWSVGGPGLTCEPTGSASK